MAEIDDAAEAAVAKLPEVLVFAGLVRTLADSLESRSIAAWLGLSFEVLDGLTFRVADELGEHALRQRAEADALNESGGDDG